MRIVFYPRNFAALSLALGTLVFLTACTRNSYNMHQTLRASHVEAPSGSPELLAVYQPWFGSKDHINVGYSSQDRVVLQKQITQARNLGITGFAVNWYGPRQQYMDRSYALLQELAAENDFKVALLYDEAVDNPGQETEAVVNDLRYAYDHYISDQSSPSQSAYLRYDGRPVIFIFPKSDKTDWNRVRQVVNSWPDPPLLIYKDSNSRYSSDFDGFFAWVEPGSQGWSPDGKNWGEGYLKDFYQRMLSKYPDKIAVGAAWPGFNDSQASWSLNRHMSSRCGKTFEDSLRLFRRYYNDERPLPFLLIVTWNDYEEGTAIERGYARCGGTENQNTANAGN
jgi:hypothetical protein